MGGDGLGITSLSVTSYDYGQGGPLKIYGGGFAPNEIPDVAWVSPGTNFTVQGDYEVDVTIESNTPIGSYTVQIGTDDYETVTGSQAFNINGDQTPSISGVTPASPWQPGAVYQNFSLSGSGFGSTGTSTDVSFSCGGGACVDNFTLGNWSDGLITGTVTVDANAGGQTVTITVKSTGYNGLNFQAGQGQSSQGSTTVQVQVRPAISLSAAQSFNDGAGPAPFSVNAVNGNPTSYQWSSSVPAGAGNNPVLTITGGNTAAITAAAGWFAAPNTPCAPLSSQYAVNVQVTFSTGVAVGGASSLTVNVPWMPGGLTDPNQLQIIGAPNISQYQPNGGGPTFWANSSQGSLARQTPTAQVFILQTSQFFAKASAHEAVHVAQFQPGGLFGNILTVAGFWAQIQNLTAPTNAALNALDSQAFANYVAAQRALIPPLLPQAEQQAYAVSDPMAPQYIYQSQCVGTY